MKRLVTYALAATTAILFSCEECPTCYDLRMKRLEECKRLGGFEISLVGFLCGYPSDAGPGACADVTNPGTCYSDGQPSQPFKEVVAF